MTETIAENAWSRRIATIGLLLAVLLVSLDGTIAATALPRIVADLQGLSYYIWVTTGYLVTSTVIQPIAGKLSDIFGRRKLITLGLIGFIGASVLAGISWTMAELVAFRAIQGLFGGILFTVPFAGIADLYPVEQRVKMQGLFGAIGGIGSIIGPLLGGAITDHLGWRWIFYLNLPVGIASLAFVLSSFPAFIQAAGRRQLDLLGSGALVAWVTPLLISFSVGGSTGWTSGSIIAMLFGIGMFFAFVLIERSAPQPVVPLALFKNRVFSIAIIIAAISGIGLYGIVFFLGLLYQAVLGTSATGSGTLLMPMMLAMAVAAPLSGQLIVRIKHYRFVATAGLLLMAMAILALSWTTPFTPSSQITAEIVLLGAGMGLTWPISTAVIQAALPLDVIGVATSQVNFWRSLGGTAGAVGLGAIFSANLSHAIQERVFSLHLPSRLMTMFASSNGQSLSTLLDPSRIATIRQGLPVALQSMFDQAVSATRLGYATAMGSAFRLTALVLIIPIIASLFLPEVHLHQNHK